MPFMSKEKQKELMAKGRAKGRALAGVLMARGKAVAPAFIVGAGVRWVEGKWVNRTYENSEGDSPLDFLSKERGSWRWPLALMGGSLAVYGKSPSAAHGLAALAGDRLADVMLNDPDADSTGIQRGPAGEAGAIPTAAGDAGAIAGGGFQFDGFRGVDSNVPQFQSGAPQDVPIAYTEEASLLSDY